MVKNCFNDKKCSIARALDVIGEWWSLLIIRDLFLGGGRARFEDLREGLGISRNVLTERLRTLTEHDVILKAPVQDGARRQEYQLTRKGWDLLPLIVGMAQWGDRWRADPENIVLQIMDKQTAQPVLPVAVRAADGHELGIEDLYVQVLLEDEFLPAAARRRREREVNGGVGSAR